MRIKKSKWAELDAQHVEAARLRANFEMWKRYCEDLRQGRETQGRGEGSRRRPERRASIFLAVAGALALSGGGFRR